MSTSATPEMSTSTTSEMPSSNTAEIPTIPTDAVIDDIPELPKYEIEVAISFDVEADGPTPGINNIIELGCVVIEMNTEKSFDDCVVEKKNWCLQSQKGCQPCKRTMAEFWNKPANAPLYARIQREARPTEEVACEFYYWWRNLTLTYKRVYFVAKPAAYDWQWIHNLVCRFVPERTVWPFKADCISSALLCLQDIYGPDYVKMVTTRSDFPHTHQATDDALEQGYMWWVIRREFSKLAFLRETCNDTSPIVLQFPISSSK